MTLLAFVGGFQWHDSTHSPLSSSLLKDIDDNGHARVTTRNFRNPDDLPRARLGDAPGENALRRSIVSDNRGKRLDGGSINLHSGLFRINKYVKVSDI